MFQRAWRIHNQDTSLTQFAASEEQTWFAFQSLSSSLMRLLLSLEGAPCPAGSSPLGLEPARSPRKGRLTCAVAGPVEELPWPPLAVVLVPQGVRPAPGPGVGPRLRAPAAALLRAADVCRLRTQGRAALLGHQAGHRHADPGELRPGPGREPAAQAAEQKRPPKRAHGFIIRSTVSRFPLLLYCFLLVFHSGS